MFSRSIFLYFTKILYDCFCHFPIFNLAILCAILGPSPFTTLYPFYSVSIRFRYMNNIALIPFGAVFCFGIISFISVHVSDPYTLTVEQQVNFSISDYYCHGFYDGCNRSVSSCLSSARDQRSIYNASRVIHLCRCVKALRVRMPSKFMVC